MLEKKKIFVDSFNKKAEDLIKRSDEKIAQYAAARQKAIKLTDPISLSLSDPKVSFSTVGELFAWVYPEAGGSENMPSAFTSVILENLAGKDSPGKAEYRILHKNFYEPISQSRYIQLKELGGEKWFDRFMSSALSKMAQVKQKISDYKTSADFETAVDDLSEGMLLGIELPDGLTAPLYDAFIESGTAKPETPSSPVNATEAAKPAGSAPINDTSNSEKSAPASTLNPEKSATAPLETTTGTVTAGKSELPKEVGKGPETGAPAVVVNVESAAPNLLASPEPAAAAAPSMPTVTSSPVNSSKETVTNNVTNNNTSAEKNTTSPIVAGDANKGVLDPTSKTTNKTKVTGSIINNLSESDAQLLKNFIEGDSNPITSATNSSVSNTTTSATNSSVSNTTTSATNSSVNEITPKEEKIIEKSSESNAYGDIVDINNISSGDAELLKKYAGFDVNSPKKDAGDKTGSTEVVKTKPALPAVKTPEVKAPLPAEPIDKKTEPVTAKEVKSESSETESPATPASMPTEYAAEQTSTQASMNTEDIEARLARIEYLLSGTLDVKIVD